MSLKLSTLTYDDKAPSSYEEPKLTIISKGNRTVYPGEKRAEEPIKISGKITISF